MSVPRSPKPRSGTLLGVSVGLVLGVSASFAVTVHAAKDQNSIPLEQIQTFSQVFGIVKSHYVDPTSDKKLMDGAINGMVSALDPHSAYLTP
ncbi:MAG: peptidase S41, partial [Gammaproteobacteria bacterium]|nr:peptidase S41 [Gammaproteobacteria bacterium]